MNNGLAENIFACNTVFCAVAGKRSGTLIDSHTAERQNNWVVESNIFVAPKAEPRKLIQDQGAVPRKMIVEAAVCINCTAVPEGNSTDHDPGLRYRGDKPRPFFAPAGIESFVVDKGIAVGLPYRGRAPDIGAYEFGAEFPFPRVGPNAGR